VETAGPSGYDARGKARGRRRHIAAGVGGTPIAVQVHTADIQDRDGAPDVIPGMPGKAPEVRRVWADSGYSGERLREARRDGCPGRAGDRAQAQWNRGFHGPVPPLGGGADLRVDVALPAAGEGLRAEPGEFRGVGAAGRVPVPGPAAGAGITR